jgi:hydroxyethylthiazole kinase-like uncharacterized protein yjeF
MKLLTAQQIRDWDAFTIKHEPITSIDLMERAVKACVNQLLLLKEWTKINGIKIFCGLGNNGGDGLAIAQLLADKGKKIEVFVVEYSSNRSADFVLNEKKLKEEKNVSITYLMETSKLPVIDNNELIIDALVGTGLNKPPEGFLLKVVRHINQFSSLTVSIDVPSGLSAELFAVDKLDGNNIIKAKHTFTFQVPKQSILCAETFPFVGEFHILDIGLHPDFLLGMETNHFYLTKDELPELKQRSKFSHKGTYGHALCIGGSYGKVGAAVLMSKTCLRTGVGLVTSFVPKVGYTILQSAFPECMVLTDDELYEIRNFPDVEEYSAVGVGPGLGTHEYTKKNFHKWLSSINKPCVIDADALNICSMLLQEHHDSFTFPHHAILTPHPKEFDRLAGISKSSEERIEKQLHFAEKHNVYVVLKGAHTSIATPEGKLYFNSTGNAGMATAGSGDVLTGMITSLLAQGYNPKDAALLGVYLHGLAGDSAAAQKGMNGLIASDIIEQIPDVLKEMTEA